MQGAAKAKGPAKGTGPAKGKGPAKEKDPAKGILRFPTASTLRKEANVDKDDVDHSDPKTARKHGKDYVKKVSEELDANAHFMPLNRSSLCSGEAIGLTCSAIRSKLMRSIWIQTYRYRPPSWQGT